MRFAVLEWRHKGLPLFLQVLVYFKVNHSCDLHCMEAS